MHVASEFRACEASPPANCCGASRPDVRGLPLDRALLLAGVQNDLVASALWLICGAKTVYTCAGSHNESQHAAHLLLVCRTTWWHLLCAKLAAP
jgi:hypothetical protein